MKTSHSFLLCLILSGIAAPIAAFAAPSDLPIKAEVDKANATLTITEGDICTIDTDKVRDGVWG